MKKEYLILGAVILALSAYLLFQTQDRTHYTLPVPEKIEKKEVDRIRLQKGDRTIELFKEGDQWTVTPQKYSVDKNAVQEILDVFPT